MVADRADLQGVRNGRVPDAAARRIVYPHHFSLEFGAGETFGGMDLVLNVRVGKRNFPFLRIGGSIEIERFFIKRFQG
ncbi:MAG: hypothetical protein NT099_00340, partial [Candidatus Saganbacteria bacterium]|nr:hypothetical protein [Candidatus Saganbacteria bacterium]